MNGVKYSGGVQTRLDSRLTMCAAVFPSGLVMIIP